METEAKEVLGKDTIRRIEWHEIGALFFPHPLLSSCSERSALHSHDVVFVMWCQPEVAPPVC